MQATSLADREFVEELEEQNVFEGVCHDITMMGKTYRMLDRNALPDHKKGDIFFNDQNEPVLTAGWGFHTQSELNGLANYQRRYFRPIN